MQNRCSRAVNTNIIIIGLRPFTIKRNEVVAIVGNNGSGKTTLVKLLTGLYQAQKGQIYYGRQNLRSLDPEEFYKQISFVSQDFIKYELTVRENIGIVQQDVYLFTGTIMDNIRYGNLEASDEEVIAAAKKANAHDFIMELEEGYDTDCGQRGVKLSGGQKQRISIARVFLKNPPILIFDEATSALDNESESIVQESLEKLSQDRTTFVIAHRLSTIKNAKHICVLTENGIEEQGNHEELMKLNGNYARLYNMQFKGEK